MKGLALIIGITTGSIVFGMAIFNILLKVVL